MDHSDHNDLAVRARDDEQAFRELYSYYIGPIYGFVMKRIGHRETTEDIVSDIFRKVFLHLKKFDSQKASFPTWIYRIATNTIIDHFRVHRNPNKGDIVDIDGISGLSSHEASPHEQVITEEEKTRICSCLHKLQAKDQEILRLKYFEEMTHEEIAEILQMTPNNVGVRVFRSLRKLKSIMTKNS